MRTVEQIIDDHFDKEYYKQENLPKRILRSQKRDKYIVSRRLKGSTFQEIGDVLFITKQRVAQIQSRIIMQMVKLPGEGKLLNDTFRQVKKSKKNARTKTNSN